MLIYDHGLLLGVDPLFIVKNLIFDFYINFVDMILNSTIIVPKLCWNQFFFLKYSQPTRLIANVPNLVKYAMFGVPSQFPARKFNISFFFWKQIITLTNTFSNIFLHINRVPYIYLGLLLANSMKIYKTPRLNHFFSLFMTMLFSYNSLKYFSSFFRLLLQSTPIKQHNLVCNTFFQYFEEYLNFMMDKKSIQFHHIFFSINISGKFGVVGNSRKRKFKYSFGLKKKNFNEFLTLNPIYRERFFLISTSTGVLGVKIKYYLLK